jgi:hypothetical protein
MCSKEAKSAWMSVRESKASLGGSFHLAAIAAYLNDNYDDDIYLKMITTRVSQNLILHKNADQPKA